MNGCLLSSLLFLVQRTLYGHPLHKFITIRGKIFDPHILCSSVTRVIILSQWAVSFSTAEIYNPVIPDTHISYYIFYVDSNLSMDLLLLFPPFWVPVCEVSFPPSHSTRELVLKLIIQENSEWSEFWKRTSLIFSVWCIFSAIWEAIQISQWMDSFLISLSGLSEDAWYPCSLVSICYIGIKNPDTVISEKW